LALADRKISYLSVELSLVIPAHNEAARIESGYDRLRPTLDALSPDRVEVIVVDDGSNDDTGRVAASLYGSLPHALVVRQETNEGKGSAVRLGIRAATAAKVVVCDADMAIDPVHLASMVAALDGAPIVFGSRTVDGVIRYDSFVRTRTGTLFNALVRRTVPTDLRDTQCGFKGFHLGAARLLGSLGLIRGFAYDVELLFLAKKLGLVVAQIPVTWHDVSGSSVRLFRDSHQMIGDIRSLPRATYECPSIHVDTVPDVDTVRNAARAVRQNGLVMASNAHDTVIIVPRDGAIAALEIARSINGTLGVTSVADLRDRTLHAV
jgi:hypothetical protein